MPPPSDRRAAWRDRVTRALVVLGLAVAVVVPFTLLAVGVERDQPGAVLLGLFFAAVVVALVVYSGPLRS